MGGKITILCYIQHAIQIFYIQNGLEYRGGQKKKPTLAAILKYFLCEIYFFVYLLLVKFRCCNVSGKQIVGTDSRISQFYLNTFDEIPACSRT